MKREQEPKVCPICKNTYTDFPAISRVDNKTPICPDCGVREALADYIKYKEEINNKHN